MRDAELAVVRRYLNHFDAELARSALQAAGIDSMVRGDDAGGMYPAIGGIDLLVRAEDAARADEVLGIVSPREDDAET